jgi:hypothetical protein
MRLPYIVLLTVLFFTASFAQSDIRSVDFKNFTYTPYCAGDEPDRIAVRNGEYSKETQMDGWIDRVYFNVLKVAYGDLNADGKSEAVILTVCNTGGTGNFTEGFVYTVKNGRPAMVARIPGGDRAYGGLHGAAVKDGILTIDSYDVGEMGGACCPEFTVSTRYKLSAGKLVTVGKPVRASLYPTERVTFTRGTSGKTVRLSLKPNEIRRFVVKAGAGQTLNVSAGSAKVSLRILEDAEVTKKGDGVSASLPKAGDYTIEVENIDAQSHEVVLLIKII